MGEQRWAKMYNCNFIGVVETDQRHGAADFAKEKESAPDDLKHLLGDVEYIDYDRRGYKEKAMVTELLRRFSHGRVKKKARSLTDLLAEAAAAAAAVSAAVPEAESEAAAAAGDPRRSSCSDKRISF